MGGSAELLCAAKEGGAIYVKRGSASVEGSSFVRNRAVRGGAIFATAIDMICDSVRTVLEVTACVFENNAAMYKTVSGRGDDVAADTAIATLRGNSLSSVNNNGGIFSLGSNCPAGSTGIKDGSVEGQDVSSPFVLPSGETELFSYVVGGNDCSPCPAGRYEARKQTRFGAMLKLFLSLAHRYSETPYSQLCAACPEGSVGDVIESKSPADCTVCPSGKYQENSGVAGTVEESCTRCEAVRARAARRTVPTTTA